MRVACTLPVIVLSAIPAFSQDPVDFNRDIRPILSDRCFTCHGPDEKQLQADLRLDRLQSATRDRDGHAAIVPGSPETSELLVRIAAGNDAGRMPPPESGQPLTAHQRELLRKWILQGAEYATHWSYRKPVRSTPPEVLHTQNVRNPIDQFVLKRLESRHLDPSVEADRYTLADDASEFLVPGKPAWLGALIETEVDHFFSPSLLLGAMNTDRATVYGGDDPWQAHLRDPEKARRFTAAMHSISARPARALAETIDFQDIGRILDVGGGSGALSIAIAEAHPHLSCTVFDLDVVCAIATEYFAASPASDRLHSLAGDMFSGPLPTGFDGVILSQTCLVPRPGSSPILWRSPP